MTGKLFQYAGRLHVSVVTLAELKTWLYRAATPTRYRDGFEVLATDLVAISINESVAKTCGVLGARLSEQGLTLPIPDLLIAATALVHDLTLVTGNERHFAAIEGLRVENWL